MGTVISNLKARFGVDSTDFKKGLKDGEKALDDFGKIGSGIVDEFASMFGVNMRGVTDAIGTAQKSLNFFGQSLKAAKGGAEVFAIGMKIVKFALVSTGIGALVVLLGSLIAYFTKSGEGADKFAKILLQIKSVVNNVIDRLAIFGKGLWEIMTGKFKQGWEDMRGAFKGMGDEIKEDWKASGDLADRMDKLEDKEIDLMNSMEQRRAKAAELRLAAKEETEDQRKKLAMLDQAAALYKSVAKDQIDIEKERLAIMKEQLRIQASDPTDEQRREIQVQEAKINELLTERDALLKGLIRERGTAAKAVAEATDLEIKKLGDLQKALTDTTTSNLKLPDFSQIKNVLAPLAQVQSVVKGIAVDLTTTLNTAFESIASGIGEFLGALVSGDAGVKDFGKLIATTFADLAINVGKIAIGAGLAVLGVKKALMTLNPGVAIAAGIALIAIGSAVKGSLSSAASGGSGGYSSTGGGLTYDNRTAGSVQQQSQKIEISGKLVAQGPDLVYVFNQENNRKNIIS
jgi:hypothetical protein